MSVVELQDTPLTIAPEPPLENLTEALIRNAVHQELSANRCENLCLFCSRDDTPEDVLFELYERGLCVTELAHRKGPRRLLERIAREKRCSEAIITVAIDLYTSSHEGLTDFRDFVREHSDSRWMLESLALRLPSSQDKAAALRHVVSGHPDAQSLLRLMQVADWERHAQTETETDKLRWLFETGEPKVWRSLANNPAVPAAILEKLAETKVVPLAREIRNSAKRTLGQI
jgi:hypothetical protein